MAPADFCEKTATIPKIIATIKNENFCIELCITLPIKAVKVFVLLAKLPFQFFTKYKSRSTSIAGSVTAADLERHESIKNAKEII
jgi:hypothetical protein